jgi:hypothetical protein
VETTNPLLEKPKMSQEEQQVDQGDNKSQIQQLGDLVVQLATGETVIMDGTIAQQCAAQLHGLYGKKEGDLLHVGLESYQEDLARNIGHWEAMRLAGLLPPDTEDSDLVTYLYATRQGDVTLADVVRFVDAAQSMTPAQRDNAALIVEPVGVEATFTPMLKQAAEDYGVRQYTNLEDVTPHLQSAACRRQAST